MPTAWTTVNLWKSMDRKKFTSCWWDRKHGKNVRQSSQTAKNLLAIHKCCKKLWKNTFQHIEQKDIFWHIQFSPCYIAEIIALLQQPNHIRKKSKITELLISLSTNNPGCQPWGVINCDDKLLKSLHLLSWNSHIS